MNKTHPLLQIMSLNRWVGKIIFSVLILIFAFPAIDATYSTGLDPSVWYGLNYFFTAHIQLGRDVLFTYGPLMFLELPAPLGHNLPISLCFISVVYIGFCYTALTLGQAINPKRWILHLVIIFIACQLLFIEELLIGITAISILLNHEKQGKWWILLSLLASIFGLYIKQSIGIACLLIVFSYCIIDWYLTHDMRRALKMIAGLIILYLIFWFCIYVNFEGCVRFLWATYQLAKDYSAVVSIHPDNNWWLLGGALILFLLLPIFSKDKKVRFFYALLFLSLFSAWKHAYSREEEVHLQVFFNFLILFFFIFLIYIENIRITYFFFIALIFTGIYRNMQLTGLYHIDNSITLNKSGNFKEEVLEYNHYLQQTIATSTENVKSRKLPTDILKLIGNNTIDVFPSELSYFAANTLNWKPRPVIQSYNTYTEWLDNEDARYFSSGKGPEYILWAFSSDRWSAINFGEIDNRYVLNNEPNAIYQLLNHYSAIYKNSSFILFKKTVTENLNLPKTVLSATTTWNKWIKVPEEQDGIVRAKMHCEGNLLRSIKTLLYKDEEFYIDCKLTNGNVIQYRIVPENAQSGIWINPLLIKDMDKFFVSSDIVSEIRFTCSNSKLMQNEIKIDWELLEIKNKPKGSTEDSSKEAYMGNFKNTYSLFMQYKQAKDTLFFNSINDFENQHEYWTPCAESITEKQTFSGKKAEQIDSAGACTSMFTLPLKNSADTSTSIILNTSAWVKLSGHAKGHLIIQMFNDKGTFFWKTRDLASYINDKTEWEQVFAEEDIPTKNMKNSQLRIYIINESIYPIYVDDFNVRLYSSQIK